MPESIKQLVISAFADHDPLLLSAFCNLRKFYMGVVLDIINDIMHSF